MGDVGGKLIEHRIERYPIAEPDLRPCMIVKSAAQIDYADHRFRRYSRRARQGVKKHGVFVAVRSSCLKNFQGIGNTDRRLFGEFLKYPILDLDRCAVAIPLAI